MSPADDGHFSFGVRRHEAASMRWPRYPMARGLLAASVLVVSTAVWVDETLAQKDDSQRYSMCGSSSRGEPSHDELEGLQIETSDIGLYERFFTQIMHAEEVQRLDHPQADFLRGYCYRHVLIVVRQDVRTPRPTGWVQMNFSVADVGALQQELEHVLQESDIAKLDDVEQAKIIRLRFKPDVHRNRCRVSRLEVNGPEGFMIGFDEVKEGSCKAENTQQQSQSGEHNRPHH